VVTSPRATDVVLTHQYAGKVRARRHIEVCSLLEGYVEQVLTKEGQAVKQGDVLARLFPTIYKEELDIAAAGARIAELKLAHTKALFEKNVVSEREVALAQADLALAQARAKLAAARLDFTVVRAPFDGVVGRLQRQAGSLVKPGTVLTTLSDNSAVWVYFDVPEARYLDYLADRDPPKAGTPVDLVLANGRRFPHAGQLAAVEAAFNSETGSIPFRADFPNPDRLLRHGQSGTVLLRRPLKNVIVVPQRATFEDRGKRYVYVVGKDGVARRREVVVRHELDDVFVVQSGLDVSDRIVLEGVRHVRDGDKVEYEYRKPEEAVGGPNTRRE
jgi:membrane fusion protein (multidrug efflux system)